MKNKITIALAVLALGASALIASAQDNTNTPPNGGGQDWQRGSGGPGGPGGRMGRRPPPLPLMEALDVNHDGVIDADEIANAPAELKTLDKNGDGVLTTNEYLPPLPPDAPADAPRPPLPLIVKALDVNHNGVIDADEIANAPAELKTLDKNGDGKLTPDELCPPRPPMDGGPDSGNDRPPGPPPGDQQDNNAAPGDPPPGNQ